MKNREQRNWRFYYTNVDNPYHKINVGTKSCKFPKRTGTWKVLQSWINKNDNIQSIGYEQV